MVWVTWRQHRIEALLSLIVILLTALFLWKTGMDLRSSFQQQGVEGIQNQSTLFSGIEILCSVAFPLLLGVFVGAPLVPHEIEQGTHRFIWTQSVTRRHWFWIKVGCLICATGMEAIILGGLLLWWEAPIETALGIWQTYDVQVVVLFGYTLFSLVLGICLGTIIQKTVPAMGLTLLLFLVFRLGIEDILRPYFLPALVMDDKFPGSYSSLSKNWVLSQQLVDQQGHPVNMPLVCSIVTQTQGSIGTCLQKYGIHNIVVYHPVNQFWAFQGIEVMIFLGFALILILMTYRSIQRLS